MPTAATYETFPRWATINAIAPDSGYLYVSGIYLPAGTTVSNITFLAGATALSAGSNQWFALFSSARAKLAISADDTSTAWAAHAAKTLAMTTPYVTPSAGIYYIGVCVVASTVPTLMVATGSGHNGADTVSPKLWGYTDSGLTNPASCPSTAGAVTLPGTVPRYYAYVS